MNHTVVALFDRPDAANQAADALIRQGFERTAIHITTQPAAELVQPSVVIEGGTGLTGRLGTLLANLFGVDEQPHRSHYEEALRRGATVLAIEVADEPRADAACDVLTKAGASNIEDRLGKWRESGWESGGTADTGAGDAAGSADSRWQVPAPGSARVYSSTVVRSYDDFSDAFMADYQVHYAAQGGSYDEYDPAYRYGHSLAYDARYANRPWEAIEADAQTGWSDRNAGSPWDKVKKAVRHAWERVKS